MQSQEIGQNGSIKPPLIYLNGSEKKVVLISGKDSKIVGEWQKKREQYLYNGDIKTESNLVSIPPQLLVIEFDHKKETKFDEGRRKALEYIDKLKGILLQDNIYFWITDHKGKSPHLRLIIKGLEYYGFEYVREYKEAFVNYLLLTIGYENSLVVVDRSLFTTEHKLIPLEHKEHWKREWKGNFEQIVFENVGGKIVEVNKKQIGDIIKDFGQSIKQESRFTRTLQLKEIDKKLL